MDDTNNTETAPLTTTRAIDALESEGYTCRLWERGDSVRIYVSKGKRELGYVDASSLDDIDRAAKNMDRAGHIRSILRGA